MEALETLPDFATALFYFMVAIITVATYSSVKKTLFNTVNTEYQKRVMDRLTLITEWLKSEFDPRSSDYSVDNLSLEENIRLIHSEFINNKNEIIERGSHSYFYPPPEPYKRIVSFLQRLKSDPFVPSEIRQFIVKYLERRADAISLSYLKAMHHYTDGLIRGEYHDELASDVIHIEDQIINSLNEYGLGAEQVKNHVDEICLILEAYIKTFDPIARTDGTFLQTSSKQI